MAAKKSNNLKEKIERKTEEKVEKVEKKIEKKIEENLGNTSGLKEICMKYKKYIATGTMVVLLAVVILSSRMASCTGSAPGGDASNPSVSNTKTDAEKEALEVDAYPEVNGLFEEYYGYYAKGDAASIESQKIAFPITDAEKSYVKLFSKFVEKYDNIKCYTKKGAEEGEYIVLVSLDMVFKDIKTAAPNLDCFYVRKDKRGAAYIDNAYSQFNQSRKEIKRENEINQIFTEFDQDEEVAALRKQVQDDYLAVLEKDKDLNEMVKTTMQKEISAWVASFDKQTDTSGDTKTDDANKAETKTRTAYATTEVNMRKSRTISSETVTTLKKGAEVTIYGTSQNGWFKIKYKGKTGYAKVDYFTTDKSKVTTKKPDSSSEKTNTDSSQNTNSTTVKKRLAYAKEAVRMRKKRSTDSAVVKMLAAGKKVMIYGTSKDGWFKVRSGGQYGYVKKEYLTTDPSKVKKEDEAGTQTAPSKKFFVEGQQITLTESVNIRKSMSESADVVGVAFKGDVLSVIMSYAEGWTKVTWNGQTGYARTDVIK